MIMIIGQKIVSQMVFSGYAWYQQADMEENQWHLDGAALVFFLFFFFNNIELAAKLIYYFFFFLLMAFRQNWKTLSRLLFLFHNMGNKMLISFLLGWQALQFKQGLKLHQHKGSYVLILCHQNCVLTALLEAKTS